MPLTIDMTTIRVVVAMTTPNKVRKERSLWLRNASIAIQKASRPVTHRETPRAPARALLIFSKVSFLLPGYQHLPDLRIEAGMSFHRVFHRRLRAQVRVDGAEIVFGQLAEVQPRHHSEGLGADLGRTLLGILAVLREAI